MGAFETSCNDVVAVGIRRVVHRDGRQTQDDAPFVRDAVGDPQGVIFGIVKREDFVFGLLHQDVKPHGKIRTNHMHQAESRRDFVLVHPHLLVIEEYEIHLYKNKRHSRRWRQG